MHGALPNHALTHPHTKVRGWMIFDVDSSYFGTKVSVHLIYIAIKGHMFVGQARIIEKSAIVYDRIL